MKKNLITLLLIAGITVFAQTKDPNKILAAVLQKFEKVIDYKVDGLVKVDMSFIKVPEMTVKIFFKKPNKVKVDAEGFAMIPKQGLQFSPADLLKEDFTAIYVRSETYDNRKIDVIKTIPSSDSSEVVLTTFWIDAAESVIRKVESTSKKGGTTQIELSYDDYKFGLPSKLKLSFNLGNIQMPANVPGQSDEHESADAAKKSRRRRGLPEGTSLKGSVIMTYTNYQINKGIPDSFFTEKEKEKKAKIN